MLGALLRLVFLNLVGNVLLSILDLPRRLRRRPRWVELTVKAPLPERPPRAGRWLGRRGPSLHALEGTLDELAADRRLEGVVLHLEEVEGGWARLASLRAALARFRARGKRLVAHLSSPGVRELVAACAADTIYVDESGPLGVRGLASEVTYFTGALARAGVEVEAIARGGYKTFAEPFTREAMSPELRETLEAILDGVEREVVGAIAARRGLEAARAAALLKGGPWTPADAAAAGLVDGVCYRDELAARLGDRVRVATLREWRASRPRVRWRRLTPRRRVRIVSLHGAIVGGEGMDAPRRLLGAEAARRVLEATLKDRRVAAVVLHVDSRGGSAAASDLIWREGVRLAKEKPVVAYFSDVAASGGYYLACGATRIVAQPTTLTGSIGVIAGKASLAGLYRKLGLKSEILARGEAAAMDSASRPWSAEERRRMEAEVEALYRQFVGKVAAGRHLTFEAAEAVARGRVWTGADALERGLVDELGDVHLAIERARELARAKDAAARDLEVEDVHPIPRRRGLLARLLGAADLAALPEPLGDLVDAAALARERVLFLTPGTWHSAP